VSSLDAVTPQHIQRFPVSLRGQAQATHMTYAPTLRSFLGWAYMVELRGGPPARGDSTGRFKQRGVRAALSESEVTRILAAIDRSSVTGRRDYAVLMLAARYGLRPEDIRQLQLDVVQWREGILSIQRRRPDGC
jgi:integrase